MTSSAIIPKAYVFCPPSYYNLLMELGVEEAFEIFIKNTKLLRWDITKNKIFAYPIQNVPYTPSPVIDALILLPSTELRLLYLNSN